MDLFSQIAEIIKPIAAPTAAAPYTGPTPAPYDLQSQMNDPQRDVTAPLIVWARDPEQEPTPPRIYTNIADVIEDVQKIGRADKLTFAQFVEMRQNIKAQEAAIIGMINKMTIPQIEKYVYKHSSSDTKKQMVIRLFDSLYGSFTLADGVSYMPGTESYSEARERVILKQTEQNYIDYCNARQAEREKKQKAIDNPETLEEFRIYLQYRKADTLSSEKLALYDLLITEGKQHQREVNKKYSSVVAAVNIEGLEMEIKKSRHTKKNIDLWVVVINRRVETDEFKDLNAKAKKFDGYYSSYRGHGAIPGFTFESEENARLFTGLKDGSVSAYDVVKNIEAEKAEQRAENLGDKAGRIADNATEELNKDRKDNTHRRAAMAASAENRALADLEFSETMQKIAEGQKAGTVKFLTRLANIVDLDTLDLTLSRAKWAYINTKKISSREQEQTDFDSLPEVIEYVKFPYPTLYKSNVLTHITSLLNTPGCKLAAARMLKRLNNFKDDVYTLKGTQELEDYDILFCTRHRGVSNNSIEHYKEALLKYRRLIRMHIESLPELRTALRELMGIKKNIEINPDLKKMQQIRELERKFIGTQIDGFFPTPRPLAESIIYKAKVTPGLTICEPEAGLGHLSEIIEEIHPDNPLTLIETNYNLAEALKLKEFENVHHEDFLQHTTKYDRFIMNPPFENGQDIEHVLHAYSLLNDGGRIVAIMAANKQKQDTHTRAFMDFLEATGGSIEENPEGSFLSAFRPTGVNTVTVIIDK